MAQSKQQQLPNTQTPARLEGGSGEERNPDAASPSEARPRNSSGAASMAASVLDLRQRVLELETVLIESGLINEDGVRRLVRMRQQGFRRGR